MKRTVTILAGVLATVILAGCGTGGTTTPTPSITPDPDEVAVSAIKWKQTATSDPGLDFPKPLRVTQPTIGFVQQGDGDKVELGQLITFDSYVVSGEDGSVVSSSYGKEGEQEKLFVSSNTANSTMMMALQSANVGARFLYVVPDYLSEDANATSEPAPQESTDPSASATPASIPSRIFAITIKSATTLPEHAAGTPMKVNPAIPQVNIPETGEPTITPLKSEPPTELIVSPILESDGAPVTEGQNVATRYVGWLWDGTSFDSTWTAETPTAFNLGDVIAGWSQGIVGQKVGSRVMIVVPPSLGYGGAGQGSVPPGATLVFLVDILAAY